MVRACLCVYGRKTDREKEERETKWLKKQLKGNHLIALPLSRVQYFNKGKGPRLLKLEQSAGRINKELSA